jgi:hypothetical protein
VLQPVAVLAVLGLLSLSEGHIGISTLRCHHLLPHSLCALGILVHGLRVELGVWESCGSIQLESTLESIGAIAQHRSYRPRINLDEVES